MRKAFRYRLCPTKAQETELFNQLRLCRNLYNAGLEERIGAYRKAKASRNYYDQANLLGEIKEALPEYKGVYSQVLQDVLKRLEKAYQAFFRRVKAGQKAGFPRFQGRDRYDSFTYPQSGFSVAEDGRTAYFSKIGNVRLRLSRPLEGKVKTATVIHDCGEWYVSYVCEVEAQLLPRTGQSVGIDVGTTHFLTTSDGEFVDNPRHFQNAMKKLRVAQCSVSRKKNKNSSSRKKAVRVVAKIHRKVSRQRLDFRHKQARRLVNENDLIAHENLNVGGLGRGNLARSIHDVGWSQFFQVLAFKAECAGKRVQAVDPRYTSQRCNVCGHTEKANRVNQSKFVCRSCGHTANADHNAALNILGRADPLSANVAIPSARVA